MSQNPTLLLHHWKTLYSLDVHAFSCAWLSGPLCLLKLLYRNSYHIFLQVDVDAKLKVVNLFINDLILLRITCRHFFFVKAKLRSSSWWIRYFVQTGLEENEVASKKFEQAATKRSYVPNCQIFHLKSLHWYLTCFHLMSFD